MARVARTSINLFSLENAAYVGAEVSFFRVEEDGSMSDELATLYADVTGSDTLDNPQTLDSDGKFQQPVYIEEPVIGQVTVDATTHTTGIIRPAITSEEAVRITRYAGLLGRIPLLYRKAEIAASQAEDVIAGQANIAKAHLPLIRGIVMQCEKRVKRWVQNTFRPVESLIVAVTADGAALSAGTAKRTFRMPYAFTLTEIPRASLVTAQTSGNVVTVDINEAGSTILSTKLTFDNGEKTTTSATTPAELSDTDLADDAEMTVDIDQIGDGTAKGLKITLIGRRV